MTTSHKASGKERIRCGWAGSDATYIAYHDTEWGVFVYDDRILFEFLILEGAQAGLLDHHLAQARRLPQSLRRLRSREGRPLRRQEARSVAARPGIVRNRLKIESAVKNARAFLALQEERGSFSDHQWSFVDGKPLQNPRASLKQLPARTPVSDALSKDLKKRGFNFVGSTIIYAHMQAVGMVNDHIDSCFRKGPCGKLAKRKR